MPGPDTPEERESKAIRLAEERGRRNQQVDNRLDGHDRSLSSINGQIARGAKATEILSDRILQLDNRIGGLAEQIRTKEQVDHAIRANAKEIAARQITRREFWVGIALVACAVLGAAVQLGGHAL